MNHCETKAARALARLDLHAADFRAIRQSYGGDGGMVDYEILDTRGDGRIVARRVKSGCCGACALRTWADAQANQ